MVDQFSVLIRGFLDVCGRRSCYPLRHTPRITDRDVPDLDPTPEEYDEIARTTRRKVAWRVLPLLFLLYVVAYLDRTNIAAAKLKMKDALQFSETIFGLGIGLFFIGYLFLEIPGAILVERWSARKWFARILVSWGCCSMAMALVETPAQFYLARFLLGLAEAGFFPGVIVYFTHWFPRKDRARALHGNARRNPGWFVIGRVPIRMAFGANVVRIGRMAVGVRGRRCAGRGAGNRGAIPPYRPTPPSTLAGSRGARVARNHAAEAANGRRLWPER